MYIIFSAVTPLEFGVLKKGREKLNEVTIKRQQCVILIDNNCYLLIKISILTSQNIFFLESACYLNVSQ